MSAEPFISHSPTLFSRSGRILSSKFSVLFNYRYGVIGLVSLAVLLMALGVTLFLAEGANKLTDDEPLERSSLSI